MAKINLLPWRAELREQRKKEFIVTIGAVFLLAVVTAGLTWMFFNARLSDQEQANQQITAANQSLDQKLQALDGLQARRDEIVARMKVIQDLQGKRPVSVRLFDELTRMIPVNLYLTRFERKGDKFTIEGRAESPNTVSEFLRSLEASSWFRNAFMNSYQGAQADEKSAKPQSGSVVPRPEDSYGEFVISVDLEEPVTTESNENMATPNNVPTDPAATSANVSAGATS
jgi:type IV pilus assembly protein PilN